MMHISMPAVCYKSSTAASVQLTSTMAFKKEHKINAYKYMTQKCSSDFFRIAQC